MPETTKKSNLTNTYFKYVPLEDSNQYEHYTNGGARRLPFDRKDGVCRNYRFIDCSFHPNCQSAAFENCEFIDCEFIGGPIQGE